MRTYRLPLEEGDTLALGAESRVYCSTYLDFDVVVKHRFEKKFREPALDMKLRKTRTIQEVRLLNFAYRLGIRTPLVLDVDKIEWRIVMQRIAADPLRFSCNSDNSKIAEIFVKFGRGVGILHNSDVIHGDLTTSNILLDKQAELWFIDFGLGYISTAIEDKAVDLLVLKHTLRSSHFSVYDTTWNAFIDGYSREFEDHKKIVNRMEIVENRIRYSH